MVHDLYLVRHGRPLPRLDVPPSQWVLDPAYEDDVRALRRVLPTDAAWFTSVEPKAVDTALLLNEMPMMVPDLGEQVRGGEWRDDFDDVVARALADPATSAADGWEPLMRTQERVLKVVEVALDAPTDIPIAMVGHATAWTMVVAAMLDRVPDIEFWRSLRMPDVLRCRETVDGWQVDRLGD